MDWDGFPFKRSQSQWNHQSETGLTAAARKIWVKHDEIGCSETQVGFDLTHQGCCNSATLWMLLHKNNRACLYFPVHVFFLWNYTDECQNTRNIDKKNLLSLFIAKQINVNRISLHQAKLHILKSSLQLVCLCEAYTRTYTANKTIIGKRGNISSRTKSPSPTLIHGKCQISTSDDKLKQRRVVEVETLTIWCCEINGHCEVNLSPETHEVRKGCC